MMMIITKHLLQTDDAKLCLLTSLRIIIFTKLEILDNKITIKLKSSTIGHFTKVLTFQALHSFQYKIRLL